MAKYKTVWEEDGFNLPRLGVEEGSSFGYFDQWYGRTNDGKGVVDYADWEARDMHEMLEKDYKGKQIESALSLPVISANWSIEPEGHGNEEANWLKEFWNTDALSGGCNTSLDQIIAMCTSAFYYKRAYFEKVYVKGTGQFKGDVVYGDVAWRPQTTCRMVRDPKTGRPMGFEQDAMFYGPEIRRNEMWPIRVEPKRAFIYTHGTHRDPMNGKSDMEVAFWAWKTKQKILLLWFQFLEGVSLPKTIVKSDDLNTAQNVAKEISRMKSSGVLPVSTPGGSDSVGIEPMDLSGKGSEQFKEAISWLDQAATQSVLAGFLDLTSSDKSGGSYALSDDASSFFLQALGAKVKEMSDQTRRQLFAPIVRNKFGSGAKVPHLKFEPLNDIDKDLATQLLQSAMALPPKNSVPNSYISGLAGQVAGYLGLDEEQIREDFRASFDAAAAQAQAESISTSGGDTSVGQEVAGVAGATKAAQDALNAGLNPGKAYSEAKKESDSRGQRARGRDDILSQAAKKALEAKTGRGDLL